MKFNVLNWYFKFFGINSNLKKDVSDVKHKFLSTFSRAIYTHFLVTSLHLVVPNENEEKQTEQ